MKDCVKCEIDEKPKYEIGQDVWGLYEKIEQKKCPHCNENIGERKASWEIKEITIGGIVASFANDKKIDILYLLPMQHIDRKTTAIHVYIPVELYAVNLVYENELFATKQEAEQAKDKKNTP